MNSVRRRLRAQQHPRLAAAGAAKDRCELRILKWPIQDEPAARRTTRNAHNLTVLCTPVDVAKRVELRQR